MILLFIKFESFKTIDDGNQQQSTNGPAGHDTTTSSEELPVNQGNPDCLFMEEDEYEELINVEVDEVDQLVNQPNFLSISDVDSLHGPKLSNINIEGRLYHAYIPQQKSGKRSHNSEAMYWILNTVFIDENTNRQLKVTFWDDHCFSFYNSDVKFYDKIRFENGSLKHEGDGMFNWGNVPYTMDISGKNNGDVKFEKIVDVIPWHNIEFTLLNQLKEKEKQNIKGMVNILDTTSTPNQVMVKTKEGSIWINFWSNNLNEYSLEKGKLYAFLGFYCKRIGESITQNPIFQLNDHKFSRICQIFKKSN